MYTRLKLLQNKQQDVSTVIHLYLAQQMSSDERLQLENSVDHLISTMSLSTSIDRIGARFLLGDNSRVIHDMHPVFFQITADSQLENVKPFANISGESAIDNGQKILFMLGSIFRLDSIRKEGYVTLVKMTICSDDNHDCQTLFQHMRQEIGEENTLLTPGTVLGKSGRLDQAELFYFEMLKALPVDDDRIENCY
ncbi:unnamed protein product [Didymodactylos carnosus]|uniref:Uncharacterized protein n=1 Tax=Didymodactylos carnosus TaxID=1234261 RepID=A0A815W8G1_9BILA|nr:unnamed protein product [Didymodactylos carnosus]CAF1540005.1 unnamed protein product [Didymodactylos carnosus]CAF3959626.1 unnamed protein product [Didymodactylos carnosus]CAF4400239.1 unnamed protein product [Didymodactylos carnosus]